MHAPLRGGNLPFRQLVVGFGAKVTLGEMAFARSLVKVRLLSRLHCAA